MILLPKNIGQLQTQKPLVLITGFLGAGKTSFLRGLLKATELLASAKRILATTCSIP
jgi:tRNA A37 threonylcarbamoyladenosine biosynthesis protein TsaE